MQEPPSSPYGDGNRIYRFDDELVILSDKINVRVKAAADPDADED